METNVRVYLVITEHGEVLGAFTAYNAELRKAVLEGLKVANKVFLREYIGAELMGERWFGKTYSKEVEKNS